MQAVRNTNVIKPGMYRIASSTTQTRAPQLNQTFRNTNPRASTSTGVAHKTNVSRPQPRSNQLKDKLYKTHPIPWLSLDDTKHMTGMYLCCAILLETILGTVLLALINLLNLGYGDLFKGDYHDKKGLTTSMETPYNPVIVDLRSLYNIPSEQPHHSTVSGLKPHTQAWLCSKTFSSQLRLHQPSFQERYCDWFPNTGSRTHREYCCPTNIRRQWPDSDDRSNADELHPFEDYKSGNSLTNLLARTGYAPEESIDFDDHLLKLLAWRLSVSFVAYSVHQVVSILPDGRENAFLNGPLRAEKALLYGLKQAPRGSGYDELSKFLISKGLQIPPLPTRYFYIRPKSTLEILKKHGMEKGQSIGTPMATKPKLDADLRGEPVDQTDYHCKIRVSCILTSSRPNIVQAVCSCGRYQARPMKTPQRAFSDADHAGCIDTRKSTSGGIQFLGDKLVSWMSKKQDCTAMSSAEAEYVALSASCAQVMWMRTQLQDYGFNYNKIPLYCDSQSAIAISCNPVQHSRTKHIHTRYHFIKEQVENGIIELYFVRTEYQLADMFTKALPEERFQYLVRRIGMRCLTPAELEVLTKESA
ncbi:hypothetical protein Tco_0839537 [Tanacetum coccineum]|uniref:Retrovirus-related Pol polyprotein from transposon TNT 1-94 n=1 Tax=Tanacetum coccineum TaxID=301880 RepID=A0ABQ5AQV3_9ASTR